MQYRELEAVLAHLIGVFPDKRPRFQARLKQLQRMGFPEGVNAGRNAKADYRAEHLFKLAFVLELLQIGITPERSISFVRSWWDKIRRGLLSAQRTDRTIGIVFWPKDFGGLTSAENVDENDQIAWSTNASSLITISENDQQDLFETAAALVSRPRSVILNVSRIWFEIMSPGQLPADVAQEIAADVDAWNSDRDIFGKALSDGHP